MTHGHAEAGKNFFKAFSAAMRTAGWQITGAFQQMLKTPFAFFALVFINGHFISFLVFREAYLVKFMYRNFPPQADPPTEDNVVAGGGDPGLASTLKRGKWA